MPHFKKNMGEHWSSFFPENHVVSEQLEQLIVY